MNIFNVSVERASEENGLLWHSALIRPLHFPLRIADAVAMAGIEAHAGCRPRAVVLLLEDVAAESGLYAPPAVRAYLEQLQVPLFVWRFGVEAPSDEPTGVPMHTSERWGEMRDLTNQQKLDYAKTGAWLGRVGVAAEEVRDELKRQRVVWLKGAHLPSRIELSEQVVGVRFAGSADDGAPATEPVIFEAN